MKKTQTAKLASNELIVKEAMSDPESLSLVPKFEKGIKRLDQINALIASYAVEQEKDLRGITTEKDLTMGSLVNLVIDISGAVHSHAFEIGNNVLMSRVNYKPNVLKHLTQAELLTVAGVVLNEALLIPADKLAAEGISAEEVMALKELIAVFSDIKTTPKEAVFDRKEASENLRALFAEGKNLLTNSLDKLITQYKKKKPEFYRRYKAARKVSYAKPAPKAPDEDANN